MIHDDTNRSHIETPRNLFPHTREMQLYSDRVESLIDYIGKAMQVCADNPERCLDILQAAVNNDSKLVLRG